MRGQQGYAQGHLRNNAMQPDKRGRVHRGCPLCRRDNSDQQTLDPDFEWGLTACASCGLVYLQIVPDGQFNEPSRAWQQSWQDEKDRRHAREPVLHRLWAVVTERPQWTKRDKLTRFIRRYVGRGRVLDIGCGTGHRAARWPRTVVPYGTDVDAGAIARADKLFQALGGYAVCAPAIEGVARFSDGFFDGVVMRAYLEHETSPLEVLLETRPKLKADGTLIVKVPNYGSVNRRIRGSRWCGYRFPDHVNYFTPRTLTRLLDLGGYSVVQFALYNRLPISDNMWLVAKPKHGPATG